MIRTWVFAWFVNKVSHRGIPTPKLMLFVKRIWLSEAIYYFVNYRPPTSFPPYSPHPPNTHHHTTRYISPPLQCRLRLSRTIHAILSRRTMYRAYLTFLAASCSFRGCPIKEASLDLRQHLIVGWKSMFTSKTRVFLAPQKCWQSSSNPSNVVIVPISAE